MVLHHERGKAGMNLLEVPIMFWPLIELFWVIYFVGGLDFKIQKAQRFITRVNFYKSKHHTFSIMLNPHQSGWQIRTTKILVFMLGND